MFIANIRLVAGTLGNRASNDAYSLVASSSSNHVVLGLEWEWLPVEGPTQQREQKLEVSPELLGLLAAATLATVLGSWFQAGLSKQIEIPCAESERAIRAMAFKPGIPKNAPP
jgi:hypothetical protein